MRLLVLLLLFFVFTSAFAEVEPLSEEEIEQFRESGGAQDNGSEEVQPLSEEEVEEFKASSNGDEEVQPLSEEEIEQFREESQDDSSSVVESDNSGDKNVFVPEESTSSFPMKWVILGILLVLISGVGFYVFFKQKEEKNEF